MTQKTGNRRRKTEDRQAGRRRRQALRVVTVFSLDFLFFFHVAFLDSLQLQWTGCDHFEVGTTLRTGDNFSFIDFFFFHIQISFAFRTKNHDSSAPIRHHFLYFVGQDVLVALACASLIWIRHAWWHAFCIVAFLSLELLNWWDLRLG